MLGRIALWVAVVTAVGSGVDYYRRFNHVLTGSRKPDVLAVAPIPNPMASIDVGERRNREERRAAGRRS